MGTLWGFVLSNGKQTKVGIVVAPGKLEANAKLLYSLQKREPDFKLVSLEEVTLGDVFVIYESEED